MRPLIYLIGSLKKQRVREVAVDLRTLGYDVFDDWQATAPNTDKHWEAYERESRGRNFREALKGRAATNAFNFDKSHLDQCAAGVLVLTEGSKQRSAHLEAGYLVGLGKPMFIFMDGEPDEFDLMYNFATEIIYDIHELIDALKRYVGGSYGR